MLTTPGSAANASLHDDWLAEASGDHAPPPPAPKSTPTPRRPALEPPSGDDWLAEGDEPEDRPARSRPGPAPRRSRSVEAAPAREPGFGLFDDGPIPEILDDPAGPRRPS